MGSGIRSSSNGASAESLAEAGLYPPVKQFLEQAGYVCKGEIRSCDVVATRAGAPPVIVELKLVLNLEVILQAVDRLALTERVYIAAPATRHAASRINDRRVRKLLRRLGVGLMTVGRGGRIDILVEPMPYRPRHDRRRYEALMREHQRRVGDPNAGGGAKRPIMTAYRQDALRCAVALAERGSATVVMLRDNTGVETAGRILLDNVYGWFERVRFGTYTLSSAGHGALVSWSGEIAALTNGASAASVR